MKFVVFEVGHLLTFLLVCLNNVRLNNIPVVTDDEFGPFIFQYTSLKVCKGPKVANVTDFKATLERQLTDDFMVFNFSIPKSVAIEMVKIHNYQIKDGENYREFKYQTTKPCKHWLISLFLKPIVMNLYNCLLKPGNVSVSFSMNKMLHAASGEKQIYGNYSGKTVVYSKTGNIACTENVFEIVPAVL